jgi:uncharacterized NAD(P)/FAD-binding protein YdhS
MSHVFAIIGAGLTGTSMLLQFLQQVRQRMEAGQTGGTDIKIMVFERQNGFGPGFPHGERFVMPYHITNMCDHDMGIIAGQPDDFRRWINANRRVLGQYAPAVESEIGLNPDTSDDCRHYPRAVMGEYLKSRFRSALDMARTLNIRVNLFPQVEVTDLSPDGHQLIIGARRIQSGRTFTETADRVLLAIGHWFEKSNHPHYLPSPWPARDLLRRVPAKEHVGVIGTSLSAIETVLTLTSDGRFKSDQSGKLQFLPASDSRKISLYSRRGLLPKVRGRSGSYRNQYLIRENVDLRRPAGKGQVTLQQIFKLLDADLECAYGHPFDWEEIMHPAGTPADMLRRSLDQALAGDGPHGELIWQTVLNQSFSLARELYLGLSLAERERFEREFATLFFIHAATQPAINAQKLLALLESGIVTVTKLGDNYKFIRDEKRDRFVFHYRDASGELRREAHRYVVNARGQEKSLWTNPSELAQNLLRSQIAQPGVPAGHSPKRRPGGIDGDNSEAAVIAGRCNSLRIDPVSHRILADASDGAVAASPLVYAVGAMTRSQIVDASMAYGIARSTAVIAEEWADSLTAA